MKPRYCRFARWRLRWAGPERGDGAGAADDHVFAVDANGVAGGGVGVSADIGDAAATAGGCRRWDVGAGLPCWQWEEVADAAAGGSLVIGEFVPNDLGGDGVATAQKFGAAAGQDVRAGGGEVDMVLAAGKASVPVVASRDGDGDAESGGGLAGGVESVMDWAVQLASGPPQLMEMTLGLFWCRGRRWRWRR